MNKSASEIKEQLYKACQDFVFEKQETIEEIIASHKNSLNSETKSSAGDKHETGRAMLQLEMEKASQQLAEVRTMKIALERVDLKKHSKVATLGSVIMTDKFNYFLSISVGKITVEGTDYFAVSTHSPIGKQLLGIEPEAILPLNKSKILKIF